MESLTVLFWALIGLRLLGIVLWLLVVSPGRRPPGARPVRVDPCLGPAAGLPPPPAPEDALQDLLFSGAMSRRDYRAAMGALAAEDERHHPVTLPPG